MQEEKISVDFSNIVQVSTVDWHNRSSCVIFFNKCPLRCIWCQNHKLLDKTNIVDINTIKDKIEESSDFVSSAVFSGGEPTLQESALDSLIRFSRKNDLLTGLQTSGYYPLVLKKLLGNNLLDKIFLDMKASPSDPTKYKTITGSDNAHSKVIESFRIVNTSPVESEVRTTVFKPFINDALEIAKFLKENDYVGTYVLQTGIPENAPNEEIRKEMRVSNNEMKNLAKKISQETGIKTMHT